MNAHIATWISLACNVLILTCIGAYVGPLRKLFARIRALEARGGHLHVIDTTRMPNARVSEAEGRGALTHCAWSKCQEPIAISDESITTLYDRLKGRLVTEAETED